MVAVTLDIGLDDARSSEDPLAGLPTALASGVAIAVVVVASDIALIGRLCRSTELPLTLTGKGASDPDIALIGLL